MIRNHQTLSCEMRTFQNMENISFTRLYSYISLHVHLYNYKSINLLKGGSTKTTLNIGNDYHRQGLLYKHF